MATNTSTQITELLNSLLSSFRIDADYRAKVLTAGSGKRYAWLSHLYGIEIG